MTQLTLSAPKPGLRKVALTKSLKAELGMSLGDAKRVTDRVVDGESVTVSVTDRPKAERMARAAREVGAVATLEELVTPRSLAG